jgi:hypothetical protein
LHGELGSSIKALAQAATRGEDGIRSANPRRYLPHLFSFILSDIDMNAPAPKKDGNADGGSRIVLGLNRFEVSSSNIVENVPTAVTLVLDHFRFELPNSDPGLNELITMGYSKVDLSSAIDLAWDEATRQVAINKLAVSDPELGVVGVNGVIDNVSKALFNGNKTEVQAAAMAAAVKAVDIKIENKGLYEKLIAKQAREQHKAPAISGPMPLRWQPSSSYISSAIRRRSMQWPKPSRRLSPIPRACMLLPALAKA